MTKQMMIEVAGAAVILLSLFIAASFLETDEEYENRIVQPPLTEKELEIRLGEEQINE